MTTLSIQSRKISCSSILALAITLVMPVIAQAQTPTDSIQVGSTLSSAGIQMRGYSSKTFPLPPGNWEVLARFDEQYQLSNRSGTASPAPKVVLTLLNKDTKGSIAAAVVTYSPEVTRIRWNNSSCEAPNGGFADAVGTTTGSLDFACVAVTYNQAGLQRFITNSASSTNVWTHTYLPPLIPYVATMPDANVWVNLGSNHDQGRTYSMTLLGRNSTNMQAGGSFDQAVRLWANGAGKALIAAHAGDASAIGEFPLVPK